MPASWTSPDKGVALVKSLKKIRRDRERVVRSRDCGLLLYSLLLCVQCRSYETGDSGFCGVVAPAASGTLYQTDKARQS